MSQNSLGGRSSDQSSPKPPRSTWILSTAHAPHGKPGRGFVTEVLLAALTARPEGALPASLPPAPVRPSGRPDGDRGPHHPDPRGSPAPEPPVLPADSPLAPGHRAADDGRPAGARGRARRRAAARLFRFTFPGSVDLPLPGLTSRPGRAPPARRLRHDAEGPGAAVRGAGVAAARSALLRTGSACTLSLCGPSEVALVFRELPPLLERTCGDSSAQAAVVTVSAVLVLPACLAAILVSRLLTVVAAILRTPSAGGRAKTFSSRASHLTVVSLFFGTLTFTCLRDHSGRSSEEGRVVAACCTTVIPMLNPLTYSLRNEDVLEALRKILNRARVS